MVLTNFDVFFWGGGSGTMYD